MTMVDRLKRMTAAQLHAGLEGDQEVALLDIREEGSFSSSHILTASNVPLSRFERLVPALVPRRGTPIVLCDEDEKRMQRAAEILAAHGYHNVAILQGGLSSWIAAGYAVFRGVYVPSKAFGEFVEVSYGTPHIDAKELKRMLDAGDDVVVLDSRPFDEYHWIGIPGAIDCPSGELVLRVREVVPSPDTLVVVNCGGRTRSIIGAQILIDAGLPNKVVSLKDGTQGWHLAGLDVARGQDRVAPLPGAQALTWGREAAARIADRFAVRVIDAAGLADFEKQSAERTLYRFDVRDPEEYRAGHRRGFRSAPGGQLVQATDTFIAVRQARIVLGDTDGVRARTTAAWLVRMGFEHVFVLGDTTIADKETGNAPETVLGLDQVTVDTIDVSELAALLESRKTVVVDVATSREYGVGHIPGAWFAVRGRLADDAARLPPSASCVITSSDSVIARMAAHELSAATRRPVRVLAGGTNAWRAQGRPLETGPTHLASTPDDVALKAFEQPKNREAAMRQYLQWEVGLVEQVRRDGTLRFRL
jgi:rhodanese-related sulfurtransferase